MAKLEIKKRTDKLDHLKKIAIQDYDVLIDGREITGLLSLDLSMNTTEFNVATVAFAVDDIDIDADVLAELKAHIENKQK